MASVCCCVNPLFLTTQVLFTISKEKLINSWKYGLAVLLLDILQVGFTPERNQGWTSVVIVIPCVLANLSTCAVQLFVFNLEDGFPWTFPKKNW